MVSYKDAGVDIGAGEKFVEKLQKLCPDIGGFGGLYPLGDNYLVASTDGVGTKLKLAFAEQRHSTIGIDLVAMCVNDIITTGARPLFFLDYFATSKLDVPQAEQVLKGILSGCEEAGCVLLGGETAEMPGFYQAGEYDLGGFAVGIVPQNEVIDGKTIVSGDLLVGLPSSGVHSNGFSLVRKVLENCEPPPFDLLEPTRIYVKEIQKIQSGHRIKGMAHITGGGLLENIPRVLPKGLGATLHKKYWETPPVFDWIQKQGDVVEEEMYRTFNMGIGMVIVSACDEAETLCREFPKCSIIGEIIEGKGVVIS